MITGGWQGEYIDIEGHRGRVYLQINQIGDDVNGSIDLGLATEDEGEQYKGSVVGSISGTQVSLSIQWQTGDPVETILTIAEPTAFAESTLYGTLSASPTMKLGGGVFIAWRFRGR